MKKSYVVTYVAGEEGSGVKTGWISCKSLTDAVTQKDRIQSKSGFGSVHICKTLETYEH
mgnify:CR=1 FL=1